MYRFHAIFCKFFLINDVFLANINRILLIYFIVGYFLGRTAPGWATIVVSIWGIGGLQLLPIGAIGEYIGKIYMEVKHRPRYIISERTEDLKEKDK